jgi:serine protease Do
VVERNDRSAILDELGADLEDLTAKDLNRMGLKGGVKVTNIKDGKLRQYTTIRPGFVITTIDNQVVMNIEHLQKILSNKRGGVMLEGLYPGWPGRYYYAFGM